MENKLDIARKKINKIDAEMARLFEERMKAAEQVAEYKRAHGMPIYDPTREAEVISRGSLAVSDEGLREYYVNFLKETMSLSRAYQSRRLEGMRVAYCGTEGAFAHIAACELFPSAEMVAYDGFDTAYAAVERGECDACVLPRYPLLDGVCRRKGKPLYRPRRHPNECGTKRPQFPRGTVGWCGGQRDHGHSCA